MFVKYIDRNGNWSEINETKESGWRSRLYLSESGVWHEIDEPKEEEKSEVQKIEPINEQVVDLETYRDYLKGKKVRGWQLLKGDSIKIKALKEGYPN